jgi:hypothetical protein
MFIRDERQQLSSRIKALQAAGERQEVIHAFAEYAEKRRRYARGNLRKLAELFADSRFSGDRTFGTRKGTDSLEEEGDDTLIRELTEEHYTGLITYSKWVVYGCYD